MIMQWQMTSGSSSDCRFRNRQFRHLLTTVAAAVGARVVWYYVVVAAALAVVVLVNLATQGLSRNCGEALHTSVP